MKQHKEKAVELVDEMVKAENRFMYKQTIIVIWVLGIFFASWAFSKIFPIIVSILV